jgi:hypothetical protein
MVSGSDRSEPKITSTSITAYVKTGRRVDFPQSAFGVSVLFDSDGRAKVADFGLAKILDRDTSTTRSLVGVSAAVSSVFLAGDRSMIR